MTASDSLDFVFPPPAIVAVPVRGARARFPVRRIYCVGRNYAAHAIEMGSDPDREPPFFFQKNPDNLVLGGADFPYPSQSRNVHHEIELVVAIGTGGRDIALDRALAHVFGYALGLDMTRRDLQEEAKKTGRPWEIGKAFEHSAPMTDIVPASAIGHPDRGEITLKVNGVLRQKGDLNQLIWKVPEMIAYLSAAFALQPGDLIFSGTPAGVAAIQRGDVLEGHCAGVADLTTRVV
jgi:fumarylpyruvate hydrolase